MWRWACACRIDKAEALIKQFGHVLPEAGPRRRARCAAAPFGEEGQQIVNRRLLAEILNARAEEVLDLILREVKRSGYDGLLPAGIVLTGGVAQLAGFAELSRDQLTMAGARGAPNGFVSSVIDLSSPEYATAVGLLLWGMRRGVVARCCRRAPQPGLFDRIMQWLEALSCIAWNRLP